MDFFETYEPIEQSTIAPQIVSIEQQQRREKLRVLEDERIALSREREEKERLIKAEKQQKAREYLEQFKKQQEDQRQQKKELNRNLKTQQQQYKNCWDKVANNIALKDGEHPGEKDVSKLRQAILNKRNDQK